MTILFLSPLASGLVPLPQWGYIVVGLALTHITIVSVTVYLHRSQALKDCGDFACPIADRLNRDAISLPCSAGLSNEDLQVVIDVVKSAAASRH